MNQDNRITLAYYWNNS